MIRLRGNARVGAFGLSRLTLKTLPASATCSRKSSTMSKINYLPNNRPHAKVTNKKWMEKAHKRTRRIDKAGTH